mgnify:CR=1 FL=1
MNGALARSLPLSRDTATRHPLFLGSEDTQSMVLSTLVFFEEEQRAAHPQIP